MNRTIISILGLIALALLIIFCIQRHVTNIQQDIKNRTVSALSSTTYDWIQVNVDGRHVVLTGIAPSKFLTEEITNIALEVYGVASVDNQTTIENQSTSTSSLTTFTPYLSQFIKNDSGIILSGLVPNEEQHKLLFKFAEKEYGAGNVTDWMEIGTGAPDDWKLAAISAISNLAFFTEGTADLIDTKISLFGRIIDNQAKKTLEEKLKNAFPKNFNIDFNLITPQLTGEENHIDAQTTQPDSSCMEKFQQNIGNQIIGFLTDSNGLELSSHAESVFTKIYGFLNLCPDSVIEVSGFTDSRGSELYNLQLSKKRAEDIVNKLVIKGIQPEKLRAMGYGESNPLAENDTEQGQSINRRIEFKLIQNGV